VGAKAGLATTKGGLAMTATLNMQDFIELMQAIDGTGLSVSVVRQHIARVGEQGVCDSQLTVLHRSGLDADIYEAAKAGTLGVVDRTVLRHVLRLPPRYGEQCEFPVWKTIRIGEYKGAKGYLAALKAAGRLVSNPAKDIMGKKAFTTASAAEDVHLVKVTPRDLMFAESPRFDRFIARGLELGLEKCQTEDGPALRLTYADQPRGEWVRVAMDITTDSGGGPRVFSVERDEGGLWLYASWCRPDRGLDLDNPWVFRSRK